jgi:uncharacterized protein YneF (UPF0154 family)
MTALWVLLGVLVTLVVGAAIGIWLATRDWRI